MEEIRTRTQPQASTSDLRKMMKEQEKKTVKGGIGGQRVERTVTGK